MVDVWDVTDEGADGTGQVFLVSRSF